MWHEAQMNVNIYSLARISQQIDQDPIELQNSGLLNHKFHSSKEDKIAQNAYLDTEISTKKKNNQQEITVNIQKKA